MSIICKQQEEENINKCWRTFIRPFIDDSKCSSRILREFHRFLDEICETKRWYCSARLNHAARDHFTLSAINPSGIVRAAYLTAGTLVQVAISTFLGDLFMYRETARVTGVKSWPGSLGFANRRTRCPCLGSSGSFLPTDSLVVSSLNDFPLVTLVQSEAFHPLRAETSGVRSNERPERQNVNKINRDR